jgi:hypothetical protein
MAETLYAWAATSLAKAVGGKLAGMAATQLLVAIGIQTSRDAGIVDRLDEMGRKLDQILEEIGRLSEQIEQLAGELRIQLTEIQRDIQDVAVSSALTAIELRYSGRPLHGSSFGSSGSSESSELSTAGSVTGMPATSLAELLRRRQRGEEIPDATIEEFARNVLITWEIDRKVFAISNALAGNADRGGAEGLLRIWTDLFTHRMGARQRSESLRSYYDLLEYNFLRYLGTQFLGVFLVASAKSLGSAPGEVAPEARHFIQEDYAPSLRRVVNRFLECVERLVFHQGHFRAPAPVVPDTYGANSELFLGVTDDATTILLRAELLARFLVSSIENEDYRQAVVGVFVHYFCRQGDLVNGRGPALKPWETRDGMRNDPGLLLPASGILQPGWMTPDDTYANVAPAGAEDQVRLVRYFFPYASIREQNPSFPYTWLDFRKHVDLTNLEVASLDEPFPASYARFAYIADFNALRAPVPEFAELLRGWGRSAWHVGAVRGAMRRGHTTVSETAQVTRHPLQPDDPYLRIHARLEVDQVQQVFTERQVTRRLQTPLFRHSGAERRNLQLHLWLSAMTYRDRWMEGLLMTGQLVITLTTPEGNRTLFDTHEVDGGRMNLWAQQGTTASAYYSGELQFTIPVGGNALITHRYDLIVDLLVRHRNPRNSLHRSIGGIETTIKDLSFFWA